MASRKYYDKSPRHIDDGHPQGEQSRNETQTTDNSAMGGTSPIVNTQSTESISLPQLESLNLLAPNIIRSTQGPPRSNTSTPERVQTWIQNVIDQSSSSAVPVESVTATIDMSEQRRISTDSLTDFQYQRFTPLHIPFASRPFSEELLSNFLVPEVPNFSPLIMSILRNPMPSNAILLRPRYPNTTDSVPQTQQDEVLSRPRSRILVRNRPENTTTTYSNLFPLLSQMTTPRRTTVPQVTCTCTSESLTPGRFMSPIRFPGSNTSILTPRIMSRVPLQPRIYSFMTPSNTRPRISATVIDPIPRPIMSPREFSTLRVVLRPRKRLGFSASAEVLGPSSPSPTINSEAVTTTVTITSKPESRDMPISPDVVPTRLESTMKPIVLNPLFPITQIPTLEHQHGSTTDTTTLLDYRSSTAEVPTPLQERRSATNVPILLRERSSTTETLVYQRIPVSELPILLNPRPPITQAAILLNPRLLVTQSNLSHSVTEAPLSRETKAAVQEISRVIAIRNPNTNEVQEYWIRRNAQMLSEIAGSVNDAAANTRAPKRVPVHTMIVKKIIKLGNPNKKKNLNGIQRKPSKHIDSQSSSSGECPHPRPQQRKAPHAHTKHALFKGARYRHIRPKPTRRCDNSDSSGYPIWRDDVSKNSSSSGSELFPIETETDETTDDEFPKLTLDEKIQSYLASIRRQRRLQEGGTDSD